MAFNIKYDECPFATPVSIIFAGFRILTVEYRKYEVDISVAKV